MVVFIADFKEKNIFIIHCRKADAENLQVLSLRLKLMTTDL